MITPQEAFVQGAQACREMMARFVTVDSAMIAMSIRANWAPSWGADPGKLEGEIPKGPRESTPSPPNRGTGRLVTVKLRGEDYDVMIDRDHGYEPDTNAHEVDWHFAGDNETGTIGESRALRRFIRPLRQPRRGTPSPCCPL